jgi:nucleotide-binding universal stress UspA family protein
MEKRFIVLIDFSEYSADLLRYAYDWSRKVGARLLLAHQTAVMSPAMADAATRVALAQVTNAEAMERLEHFARGILPGEVRVDYMASEQPIDKVFKKLREDPSDFLVLMGVKGTGRLKQIFLGSFVIDVIDQANSIVVAMPRNVTRFASEKIYVALHSEYRLNTKALDTLLQFTKGQVRELTFFSMAETKIDLPDVEEFLAQLVQKYKDRVEADYKLYHGESVYDSIRTIINNQTTELLVIQRGSASLTHQPFRKFIINELVYEGKTPLVVLP